MTRPDYTRTRSTGPIRHFGSAETRPAPSFDGYTCQEATEFFRNELTDFELMELSMYERIFTIGNVRRHNQYSIADKDG